MCSLIQWSQQTTEITCLDLCICMVDQKLLKVFKWIDSIKMNVWLIIVSTVGRCAGKDRTGRS